MSGAVQASRARDDLVLLCRRLHRRIGGRVNRSLDYLERIADPAGDLGAAGGVVGPGKAIAA